ncbi:MAG TPA: galactokinase family protein [Gemmatimonadaceae bacterium]|nr:galactokinase family protein [Gemmatimonadaceae bacterium]
MVRSFFVPGRIELFGKHVDYAGGPSLTCAIDEGITAELEPLSRPVLEVVDAHSGRTAQVPLRRDARTSHANGGAYISAVARRLARDFAPLREGVRVRTTSTLPRSAGLSSSSAFITLLTIAVADANALPERSTWKRNIPTRLALAEYCGAIEMGGPFGAFAGERGVGTRGGAQDHTAILCNEAGTVGAFRYLPAELFGRAPFPAHWRILVAVSGVRATKTGRARDDYNRASDMVRAMLEEWNISQGRADLSLASAVRSSVDARERLRELAAHSNDAPWHLARIEQFLAETERLVPQALAAIGEADGAALGRLAVESQQRAETALRNQVPETMFLARSAMAAGAHAASAFGAGFGGAVWAIVDTQDAADVRARWSAAYAKEFPMRSAKAAWLQVRPGAGVRWTGV